MAKKPAKKAKKTAVKKTAQKSAVKKAAAKKPAKQMSAKKQSAKPATKKVVAKAKPIVKAKLVAKAKPAKLVDVSAIFSPLDDRVIIEAVEEAKRTPGGLYIPDSVEAGDRPKQGRVLAVGRGHQDRKGRIRPLDVQLGDTVIFESYAGSPLKIGAHECVVLRESQLLGIVKS